LAGQVGGAPSSPDTAGRPAGLRGRWQAFRDRLLTDPRFHRWAAAFPLTRPIARRESKALFDIVAGFTYSQVLFACVRLNLFHILAEGPQTTAALARRLSLPEDAAARLLAAAASLALAGSSPKSSTRELAGSQKGLWAVAAGAEVQVRGG
jgi:demethylspheroidene O-methyltransferase